MNVIDRIRLGDGEAYKTTCRLAAMAGEPKRPNFVEWGKVYNTPDGRFRIVAGFRDTGKTTYETDSGRLGKLPSGDTFHELTAHLERVE